MDVAIGSRGDDKVAWYKNADGQGNFELGQVVTTSASGARSIATADIDSDGDQDLLSASYSDDSVRWYENLGQGMFSPGLTITSTADGATDVQVADINGDGHPDVISASEYDNTIAWYQNLDGQGTFSPAIAIDQNAVRTHSVFAADMGLDLGGFLARDEAGRAHGVDADIRY